jgi:hypothetical protein
VYIPENHDFVHIFANCYNALRDSNDDICTLAYARDRLYIFDHLHYANSAFLYESDRDEYEAIRSEDEDEEDERLYKLASYHSNRLRNPSAHYFTEISEDNSPALGVEVEVYVARYVKQAVKKLSDHENPWINNLMLELDGSLDEDHSFEVITKPLGRTEWNDFGPALCQALLDGGCTAYNSPARTRYGIHVNLHRRHLSPLAEARIMFFLCSQQNQDFVQVIAQRESIYNPKIDIGGLDAFKQTVCHLGSLGWVDSGTRLIAGSGNRIKIDNKKFKFPNGDIADEIDAIIVDFVYMNRYYTSVFDADNIVPPDCFAISDIPTDLAASKNSPQAQCSTSCALCPMNQFGTNGRGKACTNRVLLALLPSDTTAETPINILDISPTAIKGFSAYISAVARGVQRPPYGVITHIGLNPAVKYDVAVFSDPQLIEDSDLIALLRSRRSEARELLTTEPDIAAIQAASDARPKAKGLIGPRTARKPSPHASAHRQGTGTPSRQCRDVSSEQTRRKNHRLVQSPSLHRRGCCRWRHRLGPAQQRH